MVVPSQRSEGRSKGY